MSAVVARMEGEEYQESERVRSGEELWALQKHLDAFPLGGKKLCVVLDDAEFFVFHNKRDVLATLMSLQEVTCRNVCVVLVSSAPWEWFLHKRWGIRPTLIRYSCTHTVYCKCKLHTHTPTHTHTANDWKLWILLLIFIQLSYWYRHFQTYLSFFYVMNTKYRKNTIYIIVLETFCQFGAWNMNHEHVNPTDFRASSEGNLAMNRSWLYRSQMSVFITNYQCIYRQSP